MINYRVENIEALVEELKKNGVTVTDTIQTVEYGKFVHIPDVEGNKIELWEPNDIEFEKPGNRYCYRSVLNVILLFSRYKLN